VIVELLKNKSLIPDTSVNPVQVVVFAQDEKLYTKAIKTASLLRAAGVVTDLILENKKIKWVFQRADKLRAGIHLY
jgi:histidyl-tRNA synthetase